MAYLWSMQSGQKEKLPYPFLSEEEKIRLRKNRTPSQRYDMLMKLMRISRMLKSAKIISRQPPQSPEGI